MITPEMKDKVLNKLVNCGKMEGYFYLSNLSEEVSIDPDSVNAILRHFEELNFFKFKKYTIDYICFSCQVSAHDFVSHGGFVAQEELLKKNIEKLLLEMKSLKRSFPEKAASISTIISGITSAIALFK